MWGNHYSSRLISLWIIIVLKWALFTKAHCTVDCTICGDIVCCSSRHKHLAQRQPIPSHKTSKAAGGRGCAPLQRHVVLEQTRAPPGAWATLPLSEADQSATWRFGGSMRQVDLSATCCSGHGKRPD